MIGARIGIYSGKGAAFEGVLDNLTLSYYGYSFRRLSKDFLISSPIVRLRRSSDNAEMDFSYSADTNALDVNSLETGGSTNIVTWMGSDTIYVVKVYEQTGTGIHAQQTTAANQPIFDKTGFYWNGYTNAGVSRFLNIDTGSTFTTYSANAVSNTTTNATTLFDGLLSNTTCDPLVRLTNAGRYWRSPGATVIPSPWDLPGKYAWKCYYDGTTESITIGTKTYTRIVTKTLQAAIQKWGISAASTSNDCPKYELIFNPGAYDSTDSNFIEAEQKTYYGI